MSALGLAAGDGAGTSSSSSAGEGYDDSAAVAAAALAAAYPSEAPRVLPSGCAFEASLDGADFEAVPNAVSLAGLSNGEHRFSVRFGCFGVCLSVSECVWCLRGRRG